MSTAALALAVSVAGICFTVFTSWIRWPRVSVELVKTNIFRADLVSDPDQEAPVEYSFRVIAINSGAEDCTLGDVGLAQSDSRQSVRFEFMQRHQFEDMPRGPEMPVRLPAHGALAWDFDENVTSAIQPGQPVRGYVMRYRKSRVIKLRRASQVIVYSPDAAQKDRPT